MSEPDAVPLPREGEVFFDVRGEARTMRLSWYANSAVAVFSIWQGNRCTGTFRLPFGDLERMIDTLQSGPPRPHQGPPPNVGYGYPEQPGYPAYADGAAGYGPPSQYGPNYGQEPVPAAHGARPDYQDHSRYGGQPTRGHRREPNYAAEPTHYDFGNQGDPGHGYWPPDYHPPAQSDAPHYAQPTAGQDDSGHYRADYTRSGGYTGPANAGQDRTAYPGSGGYQDPLGYSGAAHYGDERGRSYPVRNQDVRGGPQDMTDPTTPHRPHRASAPPTGHGDHGAEGQRPTVSAGVPGRHAEWLAAPTYGQQDWRDERNQEEPRGPGYEPADWGAATASYRAP